MNEPHKFVLNLSQTLDLRSSDKNATLQNLSICYTFKKVRKWYDNNKLKIMALAWNDEFVLPDGSYCQIFKTASNISLKNMKD